MVDNLLKRELDAPVKSFRLYAIERILQSPDSLEYLDFLIARKNSETDSECNSMLEHAIAVINERKNGSSATIEISETEFLKTFSEATYQKKIGLLNSLNQSQTKKLSEHLPEMLSKDNMPLNVEILRSFRQIFPVAHLKTILPYLTSDSLSMRMAVMEILILKAPENLRRDLPKLLINKDPRIRSLAIRGLAAIDFEEAIQHIGLLLESGDPQSILAALHISIFFPFDRVKPYFLKTLSLINDNALIQRIGLLIENNPDTEIPFRLWELLETSSEEKKEILREILQNSCGNIEKSGILENSYQEYFAKLKNWIQKRKFIKWLRELSISIETSSSTDLHEIESRIKENLNNLQFREVLCESLNWPVSEKIKILFKGLLREEERKGDSTPKSEMLEKTNFSELSHDQKVQFIATMNESDFPKNSLFLKNIISDKNTPPDLLATSFKTALRAQCSEFVSFARSNVRSKNPQLMQSCMEYLGKYDFDWLFPYIGSYLSSDNVRIKSAAVRILNKVDPKQSISTLRTMITDKKPEYRKASLACLVYFDFISVRDILFSFMKDCDDVEDFSLGLFLFESNPDPENLYVLYQLEKLHETKLDLEKAKNIKNARKVNFEFLKQTRQNLDDTYEKSEIRLAEQFEKAVEKSKKAPAPYSVKALSKEPSIKETVIDYLNNTFQDVPYLLNKLKSYPSNYPKTSVIIVLFFVLSYFYSMIPAKISPNAVPSGSQVFSTPQTTNGVVKEASKSKIVLWGNDGKTYRIFPRSLGFFDYIPPGTKLEVKLLPFRIGSDGTIQAQCISMQAK
ncbi:MAG: hypothetical protein HQM10_18895 [Candidatus Riflebacteria bacterium]|nr:hypothetical protein [Candidatus Riflebacteria bacterium]